MALSALFGLCVPGTSQGKLEQTFPSELMVPLTDEEKVKYADAIQGDERASRIKSDAGFILLTINGGFCRIITGEGNADEAIQDFRRMLRSAGGTEGKAKTDKDQNVFIDGTIPLSDGDAVALVFTTQKGSNNGFFASAFGVHKS